jgi:predicted acetyltransferase
MSKKKILRNLMEKYNYFILADNILAGFVLINDHLEINMEMNYSIAEFFIIDLFNNHLNHLIIIYNTTNQIHSQRMTITVMPPVRI